jgi:diketogulonate reductase-like aldo/keto reductase
MRMLSLPSGKLIPVLGQGTWRMGEDRGKRLSEIAALRLGLDLGMALIDTAEMYGQGGAEEIVAEAIHGKRAEVFLVSKVYPHNASLHGTVEACERSLQRLRTDYLDLYLLHWRGSIPLAETFESFQSLKASGKIRDYGVSNFDEPDLQEVSAVRAGDKIATNQVLYNLLRRGIEWDVLPWCLKRKIPVMAYSPFEQGRLLKKLKPFANKRGITSAQLALAWILRKDGVIAIPKASSQKHARENRGALDVQLGDEEIVALDRMFPAPNRKTGLQVL